MKEQTIGTIKNILKVLALLGLIYLFLISIKLFGYAFKEMGADTAKAVMQTVKNPFLGLFVGIFATSLMQSSSMTTSLVVGMVAGGVFGVDPTESIRLAIPIIMGANIGTSVTNLLVSFGHISNPTEFRRAFPATIVHDFFNVLAVIVIFPFQYFFNIIGIIASTISNLFIGVGGAKLFNPLGYVINPVAKGILHLTPDMPWVSIIIAIVFLFAALNFIVKVMKSLVLHKIELVLDQYVFKSTARALFVGMIFTAIVQSSSITTSLVVPLAAAGVVSLKKIYPYDLGANIGTTITALLASMAVNSPEAITIALSHLIFNIMGIAIFLPLKIIPITMAEVFTEWSMKNRAIPIIYVALVFFVIPILLITFMR